MGPLDPSRLGAFLMRQIPPSDGEVVERGNVLPLGTYRTPDGRETTTLAFPQPMREGLDALAYALGYRQDPNAPTGYVTHDALNKGGQGLAESAMVGSLGARAPAGALRSGMAKPDLDPSQAARMARAREMGFDTDTTHYRGLTKVYDPDKAPYWQFFSTNPEEASGYAPKLIGDTIKPNVVPAYIKPGKNLTVEGGGANFNEIPVSALPDDVRALVAKRTARERVRTDDIADAARELGYDTVSFRNIYDRTEGVKPPPTTGMQWDEIQNLLTELTGEAPAPKPKNWEQTQALRNEPGTVTAVINPANIRARTAMFDPAKSDSANLLAANPMAGAVPLAWRQPQEQQQGPMMGEQMGRRIPPEEEAQRQALIRYLQGVQ